jgi:hypothetical protein
MRCMKSPGDRKCKMVWPQTGFLLADIENARPNTSHNTLNNPSGGYWHFMRRWLNTLFFTLHATLRCRRVNINQLKQTERVHAAYHAACWRAVNRECVARPLSMSQWKIDLLQCVQLFISNYEIRVWRWRCWHFDMWWWWLLTLSTLLTFSNQKDMITRQVFSVADTLHALGSKACLQ